MKIKLSKNSLYWIRRNSELFSIYIPSTITVFIAISTLFATLENSFKDKPFINTFLLLFSTLTGITLLFGLTVFLAIWASHKIDDFIHNNLTEDNDDS